MRSLPLVRHLQLMRSLPLVRSSYIGAAHSWARAKFEAQIAPPGRHQFHDCALYCHSGLETSPQSWRSWTDDTGRYVGRKSEVAITITPFAVLISSAPSWFKIDLLAFGGLLDAAKTLVQLDGFRPDPIRVRTVLGRAAGPFPGQCILLLQNELPPFLH